MTGILQWIGHDNLIATASLQGPLDRERAMEPEGLTLRLHPGEQGPELSFETESCKGFGAISAPRTALTRVAASRF